MIFAYIEGGMLKWRKEERMKERRVERMKEERKEGRTKGIKTEK